LGDICEYRTDYLTSLLTGIKAMKVFRHDTVFKSSNYFSQVINIPKKHR
jgi:hypothetical protein